MTNSRKRSFDLSDRKRVLFEKLLQAEGVQSVVSGRIDRRERTDSIPVSYSQQRLWFLDQLEPGNTLFNLPMVINFMQPLDVGSLERSLNEIARRHESLRTTFTTVGGEPFQRISEPAARALPVLDLSQLEEREREAELARVSNQEAREPFELERGPLWRARLVRLGAGEQVLLLTMHHIISDGWSMQLLWEELRALYAAYSQGGVSPLAELSIQYGDYAVWQREWLQGAELAQQLDYWREQLRGAPGVLELPTDRLRPSVQSFQGASQRLTLSAELTAGLKELSQRAGVTLFMTLLAAFKVLLYRYSGQAEVVVGTPVAGRNRVELEALIGFFVNTLVLRTSLAGDPSFSELLQRVKEVCLGAYSHQDLPFEKLVEELQPERDLSRNPLFQVFFNHLPDTSSDQRAEAQSAITWSQPAQTESKFDLTLYSTEQYGSIHLVLVYNTALFDRARMSEFFEQYEYLLEQIVQKPVQAINSFSLITRYAQAILPNPNELLDSSWEHAVHTLFSQQASLSPERQAIVDSDFVWTYGELDVCSNQLANYLLDNGIQRQDVVAVYAQRSAELICALLGILKAGAAFLILDPAYPASHIINCLRVCPPRGWLQLEAAGSPAVDLEEFIDALKCSARLKLPPLDRISEHDLSSRPTTDPQIEPGADDLAYIAFTSGSTGTPKAIRGRHGPLTHFLPWLEKRFDLRSTDRFSMLSGLAHDPLQRDIFTPLAIGATICIPGQEELSSPSHMVDWMKRAQVSVAHLTPALGQLLSQVVVEPFTEGLELDQFRYAFFVGDILTRNDVARIRILAPSIRCVNYYGSTETQRAVGYYVVPDKLTEDEGGRNGALPKSVIPVGTGIKDVQLLVLNSSGLMAGIGELGEIYVRSPHLADGYLGDESLTAERFSTNPFTNKAGDFLYRTGDLGRYLCDGNVEFAGRRDSQVKIRGFRIELGEVEAVISQHRLVREAVVIVHEKSAGEKQLLACFVPHSGASAPSDTDLRNFAQQRLPAYMIPTAFVSLDAMLLTPNGKIDRRALLLTAGILGAKRQETFIAPRTPIEVKLAEIWRQLLDVNRVGVEDNFFSLGGHSLLGTQLMSRIRQGFGIELRLRSLFETPTVAGLAEALENARNRTVESARPISALPRERHRAQQTDDGVITLPEALKKPGAGKG